MPMHDDGRLAGHVRVPARGFNADALRVGRLDFPAGAVVAWLAPPWCEGVAGELRLG